MIIRAITGSGTSQIASPVKSRTYLGIFNQSTTATVYIAFDTAAVAAATAGQLTIGPLGNSGVPPSMVWDGAAGSNTVPTQAINLIASAGATPVTIIEA
jgi:hypothetical protein